MRLVAAGALALVAASGAGVGFSGATFTGSSSDPSNGFVAATDWAAPAISSAVISRISSGTPTGVAGFLRQGSTYRVYANVSDANSGVTGVTADLQSLSGAGSGAVAMTAGAYSVAGVGYGFASAQQTASASLPSGDKSFSIAATDGASNGTSASFSATVDNTPPTASDVQTTNASGGTNGRPELGDKVTYTFSEPVDAGSILAGWSGGATNVVFRFTNNLTNDSFAVWNAANTTQLPLGSVATAKSYVGANVTFGATGTPSSMVMSGSTITVTLGTASGTVSTATGTAAMTWTPSATATDRAGNALAVAGVTETGAADLDF